jgi:hypothetical protein
MEELEEVELISLGLNEKIIPYKIKEFSLERLLQSKFSRNKIELKSSTKVHKNRRPIIAVTRDSEGRVYSIESETNRFQSERQIDFGDMPVFGDAWLPDRVMQTVPLYVSPERVSRRRLSRDYVHLPSELTDLLSEGILRTSGTNPTDYSVLMSVTERHGNHPLEGRTGVLLYKGKPVVVRIDGKEFLVEIKGVGCPDGDNSRIEQIHRSDYFGSGDEEYGGFDEKEGKREFRNLEIQRMRKTRTFLAGEAVRAAAVIYYETEKTNLLNETNTIRQAYLIRLTPSNIRSSFNSNPSFPKIPDREILLTTSVGQQYAELAKLEEVLLHSTIHPENIVWTGSSYVLTDFADCRRLRDIRDPHDFLRQVLEKIEEVPGITERGKTNFYSTLVNGLGVQWDTTTGYKGFIEAIWSGFFAPLVYAQRKGTDRRAREREESHRDILRIRRNKALMHIDIEGAKSFLEDEMRVLKHIDEPIAARSLRIAQDRVAYLETQLKDGTELTARFERNPNTFYRLFYLPYMKSS